MRKKKPPQLQDITSDLKNAVSNLETFAEKNESASIAHVADLSVKEGELVAKKNSPLGKTIDLARHFIASTFSGKHHNESITQVKKTLLRSIDTVKRNHLFIERLKQGNPQEQQLAASTIAAIKHYNETLEKSETSQAHWSHRIARFLYKHSGLSVDEDLKCHRIELPHITTIHCNFSHHELEVGARAFDSKVTQAFHSHLAPTVGSEQIQKELVDTTPFKQEADAIRIKTNTLLRQHGISFPTVSEALTSVRSAPIQATVDSDTSTSTLSLTLNVLPGMVIRVKGSFKRNLSSSHSSPISESFLLSWKSTQTGFPHPSQYTGWALADPLIPAYPLHLHRMPLLQPLYQRKREAIQHLMPNGRLFEHAQYLLRLKHQVFEENAVELIALHKELSLAILGAAPTDSIPLNVQEVVDNFYAYVEMQQSPLDYLAEIHQSINESYIVKPYIKLQEGWTQESEVQIWDEDKEQKQFDPPVRDFICCLGKILARASQAILLQHLSETFQSPPPMLNDLEYKFQTAAFRQLRLFLDELDWDLQAKSEKEVLVHIYVHVKKQLKADIALFNATSLEELDPEDTLFSQELEIYFNSHFYQKDDSF